MPHRAICQMVPNVRVALAFPLKAVRATARQGLVYCRYHPPLPPLFSLRAIGVQTARLAAIMMYREFQPRESSNSQLALTTRLRA